MYCTTHFKRPRVWPHISSGHIPSEVLSAYGFKPFAAQRSPVVGILELGGGYNDADNSKAFASMGQPIPNITNVNVGSSNAPGNDADGEVALDIQVAAGAASWLTARVTNVVMAWAPNNGAQSFADAIDALTKAGVDAISISWGCYDKETEVLTKDGWRYFSDIDGSEQIATLNPNTKELEYQKITQVHRYPYNGLLHSYQGRTTDLMVTPNHQMYVHQTLQKPASLIKSEAVFHKDWLYVPKTAKWVGKEIKTVSVAGHEIDADLWLEFLGYFLSEGYTSTSVTNHKERVVIKTGRRLVERRRQENGRFALAGPNDCREEFSRTYNTKAFSERTFATAVCQLKPTNIQTIQRCLDRLPFKFNRTKQGWRCSSSQLYKALAQFGKAVDKYIPGWVKDLCPRQLRIIYDALMLGDGTRNESGKQAYYTSSRHLADDVQEILLKLGFVGSIRADDRSGRRNAKGVTRHTNYRINIKEKHKTERLTNRKLVPYDDYVYCLTVPNHIMFVRRNGMPAWCGNSPEDSWTTTDRSTVGAAIDRANAAGIPVFAASGDNDSGDGESGNNCDFPAAYPGTVGCGGTNFMVVNGVAVEKVWNDGQSGTGGGFSKFYARPSYQAGAQTSNSRGVPDVCGPADPATGWSVFLNGQAQPIGGTSAVAPMWAGICAALKAAGFSGAQMLALLYAHPEMFNDVTSGNNIGYQAGTGWDACTGLGSPKGSILVPTLLGQTVPPGGGNGGGGNGGGGGGTGGGNNPPPTGPTLAQAQTVAVGAINAYANQIPYALLRRVVQGCEPGVKAALAKLWNGNTQGAVDFMAFAPHAGGTLLGGLLGQLLPILEPILIDVLKGILAPPTAKAQMRKAALEFAAANPHVDITTILGALPQIEKVIEEILALIQQFQGTPAVTTHAKFNPRVDATTVQADLAKLQELSTQLTTDQKADTDNATALATAQTNKNTSAQAVANDQTAMGLAVKQLFADVQQVYGPPAA